MTRDDIEQIESSFGITLPAALASFLHTLPADTLECKSPRWVTVRPYLSARSISENNVALRSAGAVFDDKPWPDHYFAFADDGCGNVYCLNTERGERSSVLFFDHDLSNGFAEISPDISEFLSDLVPFSRSDLNTLMEGLKSPPPSADRTADEQ